MAKKVRELRKRRDAGLSQSKKDKENQERNKPVSADSSKTVKGSKHVCTASNQLHTSYQIIHAAQAEDVNTSSSAH